MKRVTEGETNFKLKPYISKKSRKAEPETKSAENIVIVSTCSKVVKTDLNLKCRVPKQEISKQKEHSNVVTSVQWNERKPSCFASSSLDRSIILWDTSCKKLNILQKVVVHKEGVKDVKWNEDGTYLLSASFDKTSKLINAESGMCLQSYEHEDLVTRVCWHPNDSNVFLSGTMSSGVFAWDIRQKKIIKRYKSCFGQIQDLLFLRDGKTFLTSAELLRKNSMDQSIMGWDFDTTAVLSNQIYQEPYACTTLKLHPKRQNILAQSSAGYIVLFDDVKPWKLNKYKRYEGHTSAGYHIGFDISIDGNLIYCGDSGGYLFVYNDYSSNIMTKLKPFSSPLISVACNPAHESKIVSSSWDGEVCVWE